MRNLKGRVMAGRPRWLIVEDRGETVVVADTIGCGVRAEIPRPAQGETRRPGPYPDWDFLAEGR